MNRRVRITQVSNACVQRRYTSYLLRIACPSVNLNFDLGYYKSLLRAELLRKHQSIALKIASASLTFAMAPKLAPGNLLEPRDKSDDGKTKTIQGLSIAVGILAAFFLLVSRLAWLGFKWWINEEKVSNYLDDRLHFEFRQPHYCRGEEMHTSARRDRNRDNDPQRHHHTRRNDHGPRMQQPARAYAGYKAPRRGHEAFHFVDTSPRSSVSTNRKDLD